MDIPRGEGADGPPGASGWVEGEGLGVASAAPVVIPGLRLATARGVGPVFNGMRARGGNTRLLDGLPGGFPEHPGARLGGGSAHAISPGALRGQLGIGLGSMGVAAPCGSVA